MHERYDVAHDFLTPEIGWEVVTISRLVNAFFRWEFNSCENLVRGTEVHPIDYANASPDVALTSLHYYFPWAMEALVKWCVFCIVTGRRMAIDQDKRALLRHRRPRRPDLRGEAARVPALRRRLLPGRRVRGVLRGGAAVDARARRRVRRRARSSTSCSSTTVRAVFPAHEHEAMVARHRGLVGAWASDQSAQ